MNWNQVVEDLGPRLYKYFCVRFKDELADDLTQETLIRLVRKVNENKFDPRKGNLPMLAFGIAHYVALESTHLKIMESLEDWQDDLASDSDVEEIFARKSLNLKIREQFRFLTSTEQEVLTLFVDEELKIHEVAAILNMPEGSIKSHIHRAKKKLMILFQKEGLV